MQVALETSICGGWGGVHSCTMSEGGDTVQLVFKCGPVSVEVVFRVIRLCLQLYGDSQGCNEQLPRMERT